MSLSGTLAQINVWGVNPDGQPDQTYVLGDADGDSVLDRLHHRHFHQWFSTSHSRHRSRIWAGEL